MSTAATTAEVGVFWFLKTEATELPYDTARLFFFFFQYFFCINSLRTSHMHSMYFDHILLSPQDLVRVLLLQETTAKKQAGEERVYLTYSFTS
jgi:EamA domain-containing membrane protein RarD